MKQGGSSRLKLLMGLVIVAALFVAGVRIIPVYVNAYEFRDEMRVRAKLFGNEWPPKSTEVVRNDLFKKAQALDLPLRSEQIQVSSGPGGIAIVVRFTVPVDLIVLQRELDFDFRVDSASARQ